MARKTILVSHLSDKELDEKDAVQIVVKFNDARRGQYVVDAHPDAEVKKLIEAGTWQARPGRRPNPVRKRDVDAPKRRPSVVHLRTPIQEASARLQRI